MTKMVVLCGLPGSGKTTYAKKLKEEGCIIHSSDKIREELGDVNDQSKNIEVFEILHKRIKNDLQNGKSVCMDATNLSRKRRRAFLQELKNIPCKKICILVATPFEECLKQNLKRERNVPEEALWRMYKSFQIPCVEEGFDEVIIHYPKEEWKEYYGDIIDYVKSLCDFNQDNPHHMFTLGNHMLSAMDRTLYINGRVYDDVVIAAMSHDIGKVETKEFRNGKGEPTEEAHYYNHHNVGSYKSLFFRHPSYVNKLYVSLLIEFHMRPFMEWKQSEKVKEKDWKMFGKDFIYDIELLHKADLYSH